MKKNDPHADISLFKGGFLQPTRLKEIFRLGFPVFVGMLVQNLVNITDSMMVGRMGDVSGDSYPHLITEAGNGLAALGPSVMFVWLVAGLFASINVGTQALVSRRQGEERHDAAGRVVFNATTVGFFSGILVAIGGAIYLVPQVFPIFHNNPEVQRLGVEYCSVRFYSIPGWVATFAIKAFWDGIGKTHVHMVAAFIMTIGNLIANFILIFGVESLGIEPMGTVGAAWGSTISTYVGFVVVLAWMGKKKYREKYEYFHPKFSGVLIGEVYRLSLPSGIANIAIMTGFLFFTKIAGVLDDGRMLDRVDRELDRFLSVPQETIMQRIEPRALAKLPPDEREKLPERVARTRAELKELHKKIPDLLEQARLDEGVIFNEPREKISGELKRIFQVHAPKVIANELRPINFNANAAATNVVINIAMLSFIGLMGFGQGTATLVGQSLGRRKPDIAQKYGFEAVVMLTVIYIPLSLFTFFFPEILIGWFTSDPAVAQAATAPVKVWAIADLFIAAGLIFPQCLFAAGQSMFVMVVEVVMHFICLIPLTYFLAIMLDLGIFGLWLAALAYVAALATILGARFGGHSWMASKLRG